MFRSLKTIARQNARAAHISAAPPRQKSVLQSIFGSSNFDETPLNVPFPKVAQNFPTTVSDDKTVHVTTLKNGLRVVSTNADQPTAHVGVHIDAGSRYEDAGTHGISHFLEVHAYKSTTNRSAYRFVRENEKLGIHHSIAVTREQTSFSADSLRDHLPHALGSIADVVGNSEFLRHELPESTDLYSELYVEPAAEQPNQVEAIHAAAFKNNTYGNRLHATKDDLQHFTTENLVQHTQKFYVPSRIVVSAIGVSHSSLVEYWNEIFGTHKAGPAVTKAAPLYTGGDVRIHGGHDGLTHFSLGFKAPDWNSVDVVPLLVLQTLMGGGGAFSAGGPGKGMYTRLYRNVLNGHPWVIHSKCDANIYNDAGIFTVSGDSAPQDAENLVGLLVRETLAMAGPVNDVELNRAKNQLKSSILIALESRQVKQQDMGQQVLTYGKVNEAAAWIAKIDAVKGADLQRIAASLFSSPVSVAATGDVSRVPSYGNIQGFFGKGR